MWIETAENFSHLSSTKMAAAANRHGQRASVRIRMGLNATLTRA